MSPEEIKARRDEIIVRSGEWTSHNIHLAGDVYTYDQNHPQFRRQMIGHGEHLRRIVQVAADLTGQPLNELRVLDLGCLEGLYALEFARHGSQVVGIEAREPSLEKARFAQAAMGLDNVEFVQADARDLSAERFGEFDVVLCLGLLYHLDAPDVFRFVEQMAEVCRSVCIIDTHISVKPLSSLTYRGNAYHGGYFNEHAPETTLAARTKHLWASVDNVQSFWLTRPSLLNLISSAGFTSAYTCENPNTPRGWLDRDTIVAVKGRAVDMLATPGVSRARRHDEVAKLGLHPGQPGLTKRSTLRRYAGRIARVLKRRA